MVWSPEPESDPQTPYRRRTMQKLPRVSIVIHDFDPNLGQGRYCHEIVKRLADRFEFHIHANTWKPVDAPNTHYHKVLANRFNVITTIGSFLPFAELSLVRNPADVIHAQGLSSWRTDIITGHMCNGARLRHLRGAGWRSRWFAEMITPFERAFYRQRRARHLIAIARSLGRDVEQEYGWRGRTHVIYHGTDSNRFRPAADPAERRRLQERFKVPPDRWLWIFMGEAVKGLAGAIDQLEHFPNAHLLVVSRSHFADFREQAIARGVLDRITFHGYDPKPEEAFRAVDVFVYPAPYDPFGLVVTEAMASGLAVLVGVGVGASELIENGRNGMRCHPEDPASIRQGLVQLSQLPDRGSALRIAARQTVIEQSWDRCAEETAKVYEEALAERGRRAS
jgi:glycosyltransferase involved in cell wall biosynthesis